MKFLLKLFCLLSLVSSFSFSDSDVVFFFSTKDVDNYLKKSNVKFLADNKYVMFDRPDDPGHLYVGEVYGSNTYFYAGSSRGYFWNNQTGDVYYIDNDVKTNYFLDRGRWGNFTRRYEYSGTYNSSAEFLTYVSIYEFHYRFITACNAGENFNTSTKQCVPACPAGQSWDAENNLCYVDCSDKDLNKYGYPNGTVQGGCVDCSNALSNDQIMRCACSGFGSTYDPGVLAYDHDYPGFVLGSCKSGRQIYFKQRDDKKTDKDKKKDNNSTNSSDKDNPEPDKDKDKKNDNNSTNSSNKDNPNPNKKDNNENSNNSSGESGNSSNNNSGGTSGNGSSGGGGTGVETKPNPNYKGDGKEDGNGKEDGKSDGKGEEGKGDDNIGPAKLDYEGLKSSAETFEGQFKTAIDDSFSFVNDVKASLTDTLQKIKDGNLMSLKKSAVPTTCPLSFEINFVFSNKQITFDLCKVFSSVASSLYVFFYLVFFVLFLVLIIKLFLFTFMGW